jgi:rubrerythrin
MSEVTNDLKSILKVDDLTEDELVRAIRVGIKAEIDAVHLYDMIAESTDNEKVAKIMRDVAKEERVHIGEFLRLIQEIYPQEMKDYNEGAAEAEELFGNEYSNESRGESLMSRMAKLDENLKD